MINFESLKSGDIVRLDFSYAGYRPESWRYLVLDTSNPDSPRQRLFIWLHEAKPDQPMYLTRSAAYASEWTDIRHVSEATLLGQAGRTEWLQIMYTLIQSTPRPATGTDPEVFLETQSGKPIPAWTQLPAKSQVKTAQDPFWDGFQAEFRPAACVCQEELSIYLRNGLNAVKSAFPYARLSPRSVVEFPPEQLEAASEAQAAFGCEPSLNAYGHMGQQIPNPKDFPLRFAGGHIHYGIKQFFGHLPADVYNRRIIETVKFMDATVGLLGVSLAHGLDDPRRRHYYGLAGEYRLPPHGLEYRVLSNYWLIGGAPIFHLTFNVARAACQFGMYGLSKLLLDLPEDEVVAAINWSDARMARRLIQRGKDFWTALLSAIYGSSGPRTWPYLFQSVKDMGLDLDSKAILSRWASPDPKESNYAPQWRWQLRNWNHDHAMLAATAESYSEENSLKSIAEGAPSDSEAA